MITFNILVLLRIDMLHAIFCFNAVPMSIWKMQGINGDSKAMIVRSDECEGLPITLNILCCDEEREAIARAKGQVTGGKNISLARIWKKCGL